MRLAIQLFTVATVGLLLDAAPALAQSAGLDEAVGPHGTVTQQHALTPGQKNAIYNAVTQQKVRPPADRIAPAVGAPVPPSTELLDLPGQAQDDGGDDGNTSSAVLKYAFVEDQVVVVDPIAMRVVDVIRGSARP
jgi:hypothetical protein